MLRTFRNAQAKWQNWRMLQLRRRNAGKKRGCHVSKVAGRSWGERPGHCKGNLADDASICRKLLHRISCPSTAGDGDGRLMNVCNKRTLSSSARKMRAGAGAWAPVVPTSTKTNMTDPSYGCATRIWRRPMCKRSGARNRPRIGSEKSKRIQESQFWESWTRRGGGDPRGGGWWW